MAARITIKETTVWHTYKTYQFGLGIVGKRSAKTHPAAYDGDSVFVHKMSEKGDLTDEQKQEIQNDCDSLVALLKKFYHDDDYVS